MEVEVEVAVEVELESSPAVEVVGVPLLPPLQEEEVQVEEEVTLSSMKVKESQVTLLVFWTVVDLLVVLRVSIETIKERRERMKRLIVFIVVVFVVGVVVVVFGNVSEFHILYSTAETCFRI